MLRNIVWLALGIGVGVLSMTLLAAQPGGVRRISVRYHGLSDQEMLTASTGSSAISREMTTIRSLPIRLVADAISV